MACTFLLSVVDLVMSMTILSLVPRVNGPGQI